METQEIQFGAGGTDAHYLGAGWSGDEPGYRWTVGMRSDLWLNHPGADSGFVLELDLAPFVHPPELPRQRLAVSIRGKLLGQIELRTERVIGLRLPASLLEGSGPLHLVFEHPDAAVPAAVAGHPRDGRQLGFAFRRLRLRPMAEGNGATRIEGSGGVVGADIGQLIGTPAAQFMLRFESLGDNCEFGLVQRRCGAEPLGLLRFSNISLGNLLRGIETGFEGLGDPTDLSFDLVQGARLEYVLRDRRFGLTFHTFLHQGEVNESEFIVQQSTRLKFLRRKLLEDIAVGEKIFVIKRDDPLSETEILPLHGLLSRDAANTLLFVIPATPGNPPGTVEQLMPGLLRGYVERFAPYDNAHDLSLPSWLAVSVNAARLISSQPATKNIVKIAAPAESRSSSLGTAPEDTRATEVRRAKALNAIFLPRRPALVLPTHDELYDQAAAHIGVDTPIHLLEFGVADGRSIRAFARRFRHPDARFVGFDSFVGLPESWMMHQKGAFSTHGIPPKIEDDRVEFVVGWFQNTVPSFLDRRHPSQAPVLVHFDADLWSSTMFLLGALWHHIPEYFFVMDDFVHDDALALNDFVSAHPVQLEFFAQTAGGGDPPNPDQVFGHVSRTNFVP